MEVLRLNQYVQSLCKQSTTYLINELLWCKRGGGRRWVHLIIGTDFHFQIVELEQNKSQTFKCDLLLTNVVSLNWSQSILSPATLSGTAGQWKVGAPFVFRAAPILQLLGHIHMVTSRSCCISVSCSSMMRISPSILSQRWTFQFLAGWKDTS